MAHKAACHTLSKVPFEIYEDMVQILLMLTVLFTQDSEVEDLFYGAFPGSEPGLFFNNLFRLWIEPVQDYFQHDFSWMTYDAYGSVILAKLSAALFWEWNNQRPRGRSFSCFPDLVTDFCQNIDHGLPACLNKFCWYIINSCRLPFFQWNYCDLNFLTKDWL